MVHALKEAWRVVRCPQPGELTEPPFERGVLDVRPQPGDPLIFVHHADVRETRCGALRRKEPDYDRHAAANAAVESVLQDDWFKLVAVRNFEWIDEYDTADELLEDVEETWSSRLIDEDTALALVHTLDAAGPGAFPFIRQSIGLRFLQKRERPP